jgi:hypothetical protein
VDFAGLVWGGRGLFGVVVMSYLMWALAILSALVFGGCLLAVQIRVWSSGGSFLWMPDWAKELDRTDKRLAIVAGISFLVFMVCIVLATT